MHICADIRSESSVVNLTYAVVLKPFKYMTPTSVKGGFNGGGNDNRNVSSLHQIQQHIEIVSIISRSVWAGLYALSASNTFIVNALYLTVFHLIGRRHWTGSYTGVTTYTLILVDSYTYQS